MESFSIAPYSRSGNCCASLHMLPAFLSAVANIVMIACLIIFKLPHFVIAPGVGLLFSLHFIFLAHKIQLLDTYAQNNRLLRNNVDDLSCEVGALKSTKEAFTQEVSLLTQNNTSLKDNLSVAQNHVTELTALKEKQSSLLAEQEEQLSRLERAIAEEKENYKKQQALCQEQADHIGLLVQVGAQHLQQFHTIGKDFEIGMGTLGTNIDRFEMGLKNLAELQQVKDELLLTSERISSAILRESRFIEYRQNTLADIRAQEAALQTQIAVNQALAKATNIEIAELRSIKQQSAAEVLKISEEISRLRTEIAKLEYQRSELSKLLEKLIQQTNHTQPTPKDG